MSLLAVGSYQFQDQLLLIITELFHKPITILKCLNWENAPFKNKR